MRKHSSAPASLKSALTGIITVIKVTDFEYYIIYTFHVKYITMDDRENKYFTQKKYQIFSSSTYVYFRSEP